MARAKRSVERAEADKQVQAAIDQLRSLGAIDLSERIQRNELTAAHGRERELERIFSALAERRSVLLIGATGVGKSAIIYEAAARMLHGRAPEPLRGVHMVQISTTALEAGSINAGVWGGRLQQMLNAVKLANGGVIVYVDNIWNLPEAGRYMGARESFSTFLRPHIENRALVLIGESTQDNLTHGGGRERYRGFAISDDPLMADLVAVDVHEPGLPATREIVQIVAFELEETIRVRIDSVVVERVIELAGRFQPYEAFPGKAIRLLERVARAARANGQQQDAAAMLSLTPAMVIECFARQTGLPERLFSDTVPLTHTEVESYFAERVVGQDEAVATLVDLVALIKAELTDPRRPLGVLLFVGPTGAGKTFLARTMAEFLFGSDSRLVRFDMSEYQNPASVDYLQRQLTDRVRQQRFSVILLDELEKAAINIFDLFLQAFDDARITDADGQTIDLKNVVFVMTSNLGGGAIAPRNLGFGTDTPSEAVAEDRARRMRAVRDTFRPEFINRLDKIVVFRPLDRAAMRLIARRELGRALEREGIRRRSILLDFCQDVLDVLLEAGFTEEFGARPLQRALKELVLVPLARRIAADPSATDQLLQLRAEDGHVVIDMIPLQAPSSVPQALASPDSVEEPAESRPAFDNLVKDIAALQAGIAEQLAGPRFASVESRVAALLRDLERPSFWDDQMRARQVNNAIYHLSRITQRTIDLRRRIEALAEVPTILRRHTRVGNMQELRRLERHVRELEDEFGLVRLELAAANSIEVSESAELGAATCRVCVESFSAMGARKSSDWPGLLAHMYLAWALRRGYDAEMSESAESADADGMNAVRISGPGVVEMLRGEAGVHKRQTASDGRPSVQLAAVTVVAEGAPAPMLAGSRPPEVVRVYHLGGAPYVRDPRTGCRSRQPREVLAGAIDQFLLAFLESTKAP